MGFFVLIVCMMIKKRDLPEKKCAVCNLPFKWRKKWRNNWKYVTYCSERCRRKKTSLKKDLF